MKRIPALANRDLLKLLKLETKIKNKQKNLKKNDTHAILLRKIVEDRNRSSFF
jgi:hypothetical protein